MAEHGDTIRHEEAIFGRQVEANGRSKYLTVDLLFKGLAESPIGMEEHYWPE